MARRAKGEGSLTYWEAKKLWVGKLTMPNGKRRTKYAKTQKEIKEWILKERSKVSQGMYIPDENLKVGLLNTDPYTLGSTPSGVVTCSLTWSMFTQPLCFFAILTAIHLQFSRNSFLVFSNKSNTCCLVFIIQKFPLLTHRC